ncbi:histidine ammonia-lyase [Brevibacillus humidisoli]|uniref:histidine ammonia-lyase n=1 Tax=Brevibacillus humidisoli TaxID=2895522 RepID=UPI001E4926E3|nr:histidine ammonia-lyase [Brevibacillus humidisoli]UFJ39509.1 histidine ammonia-lyase [Brevibacillus humidisoli]
MCLPNKVTIDHDDLRIEELVAVARYHAQLELADEVKARIVHGRSLVERFVFEERVVYGITTGVGDNARVKISTADSKELQKNLIMSHACGVGEPLAQEQVRAIIMMMIQSLSQGYSGVRLETVEALVSLLNHEITPLVPKEGSLGYLSHQAHISLVLLGMGEAICDGRQMSGREALHSCGLEPIELFEKEGLSLINGTVDMTALGALAVYDAINLLKTADIVSMISFEALKGTYRAYDPRIARVKRHPGIQKTIENIQQLIKGSEIAERFKDYRTQDALSIRSIPQIHGASKDVVAFVREVIEREINSASDNPLVFDEHGGVAISSANCHGESVAMAMDMLAMAITEISNVSERRIFRLVSPQYSGHPAFLVDKSGVHSGYMIPQYTAAALVSDNKVLSHPASVDSIPTTAGQEDHVSMGTSAALKAVKVIGNTENVLGIEWMCSSQALEFMQPLKPGVGTAAAYHLFRQHVPPLEQDRVLSPDIRQAADLIRSGKLVGLIEEEIGELQV